MVNITSTNNSPNDEPPAPNWGTVKEAAERLNVSAMTVGRYGRRGLITVRRKGPRLMEVDLNSLDAIYAPLEGAEVAAQAGA